MTAVCCVVARLDSLAEAFASVARAPRTVSAHGSDWRVFSPVRQALPRRPDRRVRTIASYIAEQGRGGAHNHCHSCGHVAAKMAAKPEMHHVPQSV